MKKRKHQLWNLFCVFSPPCLCTRKRFEMITSVNEISTFSEAIHLLLTINDIEQTTLR